MDKKCYCINPSCKCLFGCGCTLADKSVGKCMCCIMEETNQKIDKLRRKKTTTIIQEITKVEGSTGGNQCDCDLKDGSRFYDIIVVDNNDYVSCRYGCSVTFDSTPTVNRWYDTYIKSTELHSIAKEIDCKIIYDLKTDDMPYDNPKFNEDNYLLLFIHKETLEYAVFYIYHQNLKHN